MKVYIVLHDKPVGLMCQYCETEIIDVFEYESAAEECAKECDSYRIEEWYVSGT